MRTTLRSVLERLVFASRLLPYLAIAAAAAAAVFMQPLSAKEVAVPPTVLLVHGAFADASSWNSVIAGLRAKGLPVVAVANPLRGVRSDAAYVESLMASIDGPVILVGHSYGGSVISNVNASSDKLRGLVYIAAFAPEAGESAAELAGRFPGSTLGPTLSPPVPLADGGHDLYIQTSKFHDQFAADLPASLTLLMAATQRPIAEAALTEPSGSPAWKRAPSWFLYGSADKNIPPALQSFMAQRADARQTVVVAGASHVVMTSHPDRVVRLIVDAARAAALEQPLSTHGE